MVISIFSRAKYLRLSCIASGVSALAVMGLPVKIATQAEAKTPGSTYCYFGVCHRVKTIEETRSLVGRPQSIMASHYDDCKRDRYNPCGLTSSGERFRPNQPDNTASPIYPDGTTLLVWNPETKHALVVRVNNAGPYHGNRKLDLSVAAAEKLGFKGKGVAELRVKVVKAPEPDEAKYSKYRSYAQVPGDIGEYSSVEEAEKGMAVAYALQASATSLLAPVTARVFSAPNHEYLVAETPQVGSRARARLAAMRVPKLGRGPLADGRDNVEVSEIQPETIAYVPVAEIDAAAATEGVTAKAAQQQVAAVNASDTRKAESVGRASSKKKNARSTRGAKRSRKVASRRSRTRAKSADHRGGAEGGKRVRAAAVREKQPKHYRFHANSLSDFHQRHMRSASSG